MSKKEKQRKFQKAICEGLQRLCVEDNKDNSYKFAMDTILGRLFITIHDSDIQDSSKVYSVYTKFEEPKKAKEKVDCNPFSGKWNFHYDVDDSDPLDLAAHVISRIEKYMAV